MKSGGLSFVALLFAALVSAQSVPDLRFNGHTLGETAETFFATATMMESKAVTKDYCKTLLNDADTMKRYEASRTGINKRDFLLSDVGGCKDVMTALRGERAPVGARFASELGKGHVLFVAGKLTSFTLDTDSPYADVVSEMTKRFRASGDKYTQGKGETKISGTRWNLDGATVLVFKLPYHDDAAIYVGYSENPTSN